jgi:hypothetical protein
MILESTLSLQYHDREISNPMLSYQSARLKVNLKYNNSSDKESIIEFARIMAKSSLMIPYVSHVDTFASKMIIIQTDRSPVDFVCHAL